MTRREHEITDIDQIIHILDTCKIVHLAFIDEDKPYLIPMNFGYSLEDGALTLYVHGATESYKLDVIRRNPLTGFEMECDLEPFTGRLPCQYGLAYSTLFGRGFSEIIEDLEEKGNALSTLCKAQTGKEFTFDEKMLSIVSVIKINVTEYFAKQRLLPEGLRK
ncbi:MAG: pyridoxamine 5'-phosphate oxidase family protein [bacterium]|nr:pyridoxamine 5'-phosphate oxidase family protein [bacterium]